MKTVEEPDAVVPHVRFCEGAGGAIPRLYSIAVQPHRPRRILPPQDADDLLRFSGKTAKGPEPMAETLQRRESPPGLSKPGKTAH